MSSPPQAPTTTPPKPHPSIYIIGAQCTGKTTLVLALKQHFSTATPLSPPTTITEIARNLLQAQNITRDDIRFNPEKSLRFQNAILEAQLQQETSCSGSGSMLLSDRSGLDPIVYAKRYGPQGGATAMLASATWAELRRRLLAAAVIVVCEPRAEWLVDDGTRLMPLDWGDWVETHRVFCALLGECGLRYEVLPAAVHLLSERVEFVLGCWSRVLERGEAVA